MVAASVVAGERWREYLLEDWALAMFMLGAAVVSVLPESPAGPGHRLPPEPTMRRALTGLAMGIIAVEAPLGMLSAAGVVRSKRPRGCAKLWHTHDVRCIR
jgi:hypothetical protein